MSDPSILLACEEMCKDLASRTGIRAVHEATFVTQFEAGDSIASFGGLMIITNPVNPTRCFTFDVNGIPVEHHLTP